MEAEFLVDDDYLNSERERKTFHRNCDRDQRHAWWIDDEGREVLD